MQANSIQQSNNQKPTRTLINSLDCYVTRQGYKLSMRQLMTYLKMDNHSDLPKIEA